MRDIFNDIFENQPKDPMVSARQGAKTPLRKRFYKEARAGEAGQQGHPLLLDGKPVMTPARRPLLAPSPVLADALAGEWQAQEIEIDPARMPLTRLANVIVDGIVPAPAAVADEIGKYLGSDLLCYRAHEPAGLVARQNELWNPVLDWARDDLGARFVLIEGIVFAEQPREAIEAARKVIPVDSSDLKNIWRLGAMASVTTITGSALIALALNAGAFGADALWAAAHVDEDFQMSQWGRYEAAIERRAARFAEYEAAAKVLKLV
ncbi:ATP12 family chaperone protein [Undibacter mobilis]|uniref:ATPase n=1 Tax=Undibacter mobilis TaxID=2292256 RepID=A0A371BCY7_9BRAD|nr:ATP12 family protein [Undibacter mobilis]RDV05452.1 ATPase [Undibacter mobilis]